MERKDQVKPLTELPEGELKHTLEQMYPEEMGVEDSETTPAIRLRRVYSQKGQYTHQELRQSHGQQSQLKREHPDYITQTPASPRQRLLQRLLKQSKRWGGNIPQQSAQSLMPDIAPGMTRARAGIKSAAERVELAKSNINNVVSILRYLKDSK